MSHRGRTVDTFKFAVRRIISRSPLNTLCSTKNRRLAIQNKMQLNICVSEMALFGPFAAVISGEMVSDSDGTKGGLPTRRDRSPLGTKVFSSERQGLCSRFRIFRTLCGAQPSPLRFAGNRASPFLYRVVRYRRRHGERPYPSCLS